MARGYARSADYHARCREAEAARYARARPATNVGGQ